MRTAIDLAAASNSNSGAATAAQITALEANTAKVTGAVDASGFDGNLATTDDTPQEIAQVVDDLTSGGTDDQIAAEVTVADVLVNYDSATKNVETIFAEIAADFGNYALTSELTTYINALNLDLRGTITVASASSFTISHTQYSSAS